MYIWVILATFIVALYSFNLSYRSDIRSVEIKPVARALISKLLIKQAAAGRYMRGNTPPYASITNPDGSIVESDTVTYGAGILSSADLHPNEGTTYLPYGFKDDNSVTTEIYCVDKNTPSNARACTHENSINYLVSYMPIPQRWLNVKTGLPNNDLNAAIQEMVGNDSGFGYPVCKEHIEDATTGEEVCNKMVIRSMVGTYTKGYTETGDAELTEDYLFEIPPYIMKNGGFARTCGEGSGRLCLMYIYEYKSKYYN